ncbi:PepSY domain-containing protein [Phytohabitans suffuscus]|uniref:PepSY domain-containing protein n=1 Tax=Phytohabitans suffuscus TaxID=624315 RepID=UPI0018D90755|nr:PepSY domain-containing protein [Phytohabitans suffuscus]
MAGAAIPILGAAALATAGDDDRRRTGANEAGFEIEIDPELDARFGPRPVNAVQAAAIVTERFPGARVIEAELDEEDGEPIWEIEFILRGDEREVDVSGNDGRILDEDD